MSAFILYITDCIFQDGHFFRIEQARKERETIEACTCQKQTKKE